MCSALSSRGTSMTRTTSALIVSALLAGSRVALAQHVVGAHPDKTVPAPVVLDTKGFQAVIARVGSDLYISGQPTADALRQLHDKGVTTIVNLRTPEEMAAIGFDEAAEASKLGMKYIHLPVRGSADMPYSPATVDAFSRALKEANGGVLLHCTVAWRASHLWSAYLIHDRGLPVDSALANGRAINLMDDHHMSNGRQPVEDFLGRDLDALRSKRTP
jgi:uncharacterized protein (TIGR01244 family)